eukprot:1194714-Prorocentrum_minimum.AAC.7
MSFRSRATTRSPLRATPIQDESARVGFEPRSSRATSAPSVSTRGGWMRSRRLPHTRSASARAVVIASRQLNECGEARERGSDTSNTSKS